jgi:uncharacterized membrane protein
MDRSSFPNKQQDKSSFSNEKKEDSYEKKEDISAFNSSGNANSSQTPSSANRNADYINDCIIDVCINGSSLVAYKKQIAKLYPGADLYTKIESFLEEVNNSERAKKFTNTSVKNLRYLGEEIYLTPDTVSKIVNHYNNLFSKEKKQKEEAIRRKQQEEKEKQRKQQEEEKEKQRKQQEEEEEKQRKQQEEEEKKINKINKFNRNYLIGSTTAAIISLAAIAASGWWIFISFVTSIGTAILLTFWYAFIDNNPKAKQYIKHIILVAGILLFILFFIVFFYNHKWWSLFSILLIPVFAFINVIVEDISR